jgi:DNA/RNA-binding domain of Phe-tRNA-synthetase-like protein
VKYKLLVDPDIFSKFPQYRVLVIYAQNLENRPSDDESIKMLREAEEEQRNIFGMEKPSSHPHISAWRDAYKSFGAKASKYLCSVEALLSRTLKGQDLPEINQLVDLYNGISIKHVLPVGGEDWDTITSNLTLTFATGTEPFTTYQDGKEVIDHPESGEVIWADSTGVTCRRWNWRQCIRTQLTTDTRNAYFVLDSLPPCSKASLIDAGNNLMDLLKIFSPDCTLDYEILESVTNPY